MPTLIVAKNPLAPHDHARHRMDTGQMIIEALQQHYPAGFGTPCRVFVDGQEIPVEETDRQVAEDATVVVMVTPAAELATALLISLISSLISYAITALFAKPKAPTQLGRQDPSTIYQVSSQQNAARLGQPVPVIYGEVLMVPDYVSQPYTFYDQGSHTDTFVREAVYYEEGGTAQTLADNYNLSGYQFIALTGDSTVPLVQGDIVPGGTGYVETTVTGPDGSGSGTALFIGGYTRNPSAPYKGTLAYATTGTAFARWGQGDDVQTGGVTYTVSIYNVVEQPGDLDQSANQYLDMLLCVSKGTAIVDQVLIGDVNADELEPGIAEYHVLTPPEHGNTMGAFANLFTIGRGKTFYENVATSSAVGGQEFKEPTQVGAFALSQSGQQGQFVDFDIAFPAGLHNTNTSNGQATDRTVVLQLIIQEIDANLNPVGSPMVSEQTVELHTVNPMRFTYRVDGGKVANWQASVARLTSAPQSSTTQDTFIWEAVKLIVEDTLTPVYEDSTLMAIRIRATKGIGANATNRVRVRTRRMIPRLSDDAMVATDNPADVGYDVYCNTDYGANRPPEELETDAWLDARAAWDGEPGFNAVFTEETTVYEALSMVLQPVATRPLPVGSLMSLVRDKIVPVRTQLYTESNIVEGTLTITYTFDPEGQGDGVEVEYRDPLTFDPAYVRVPSGSVRPERLTLFGCTDATQALEYGNLFWNKRRYERKEVAFETEMEGLIPRLGDRVAVQHSLADWSQGSTVVQAYQETIWAAKDFDWSALTTPYAMLRTPTGEATTPVPVTRGSDDNVVILPAPPSFQPYIGVNGEATSIILGDAQDSFEDFIVAEINPTGEQRVRIAGYRYDERVYTDAMPYTRSLT